VLGAVWFVAIISLATRATAMSTVARHASCGGESATLQNDEHKKENDRSKKQREQRLVAATAKS